MYGIAQNQRSFPTTLPHAPTTQGFNQYAQTLSLPQQQQYAQDARAQYNQANPGQQYTRSVGASAQPSAQPMSQFGSPLASASQPPSVQLPSQGYQQAPANSGFSELPHEYWKDPNYTAPAAPSDPNAPAAGHSGASGLAYWGENGIRTRNADGSYTGYSDTIRPMDISGQPEFMPGSYMPRGVPAPPVYAPDQAGPQRPVNLDLLRANIQKTLSRAPGQAPVRPSMVRMSDGNMQDADAIARIQSSQRAMGFGVQPQRNPLLAALYGGDMVGPFVKPQTYVPQPNTAASVNARRVAAIGGRAPWLVDNPHTALSNPHGVRIENGQLLNY